MGLTECFVTEELSGSRTSAHRWERLGKMIPKYLQEIWRGTLYEGMEC